MKALSVNDVTMNFGGLQALHKVKLTLDVGQRHGLIGPNGAGKTTLLHLISGVLSPSQGRISLFGVDITRMAPYKRAMLGLGRTYQITQLFPKLTVQDSVLMGVMASDSSKISLLRPISSYPRLIDRRAELLNEWRLWEKRDMLVCDLSYGEQRQLEIILALAIKPRLLLLDEPTAGLAAAERELVCSMVCSLPKDITMLIIEHDMDTAPKLVDSLTVLSWGEVIAEGTWEQIRINPKVQDIYLGRVNHE
jgi:branched-chain amino acid transport system ATP-binding protein